MQRECYDTVIFGASFLGMGAALALKECAVIESGGLFGAEFVNNYKITRPGPVTVNTAPGREFFRELEKRGLVSPEGEMYQAPAVYVLSKFLKERPVNVRLMTEVTAPLRGGLEKKDGLYHITLYHVKGFETIRAKRIIDTTALGKGHGKKPPEKTGKCLNAVIYNPGGGGMAGLSHNRVSGLYVYSLPVPLEMKRYEGVEKICGLEKTFREHNMKISSIAPEFSYDMEPFMEKIEDNFLWQPSISCASLVSAFDTGAALAERINTHDPL